MVDPEGAGESRCSSSAARARAAASSVPRRTRRGSSACARRCQSHARCVSVPTRCAFPFRGRVCGEKSREIRAVLERFSPVVEGASIDEWYLDMGGTEGVYGHEPLAVTAERIREAVAAATKLSVSIGGGTTKLVAKLAVERAKPKPGTSATGVHIVDAGRRRRRFSRRSSSLTFRWSVRASRSDSRSSECVALPMCCQYDVPDARAVARRA